uniref:Myb/SANT-like DNA-binding domain-containing protein n=1 Tax=Scylla olivacea TaxID=85551 RepID=A0A0P4WH86_SCYOL
MSEAEGDAEVYQTFELSDGCRSVTIIASKEEEERIQQDQEYANEKFLLALSESSAVDEGDFTHNATLLLIECIRDRFEKFCASRFEKNQVYREIQEELRSYSYNMSIEKIRNKWSNLVTTYKRIKFRQRTSGAGRRVWEYYQQLDELLSPSCESPVPGKISVSMIKTESTDTEQQNTDNGIAIKLEDSMDTSFTESDYPQLQTVTSVFSTIPSQAKRKYDESLNNVDNYSEKERRREELLEQFLQEVSEKETKEHNYKKRKERRDRMKLKTLQKMVSKLETLSKTQELLLKKQELVLEGIMQSKNKNS